MILSKRGLLKGLLATTAAAIAKPAIALAGHLPEPIRRWARLDELILRSNEAAARELECALDLAGIPYQLPPGPASQYVDCDINSERRKASDALNEYLIEEMKDMHLWEKRNEKPSIEKE